MIGERMTKLLEATAKDAQRGVPPLSEHFLIEHDVTLDEAYSLGSWIAASIMTTVDLDQTGAHGQNLIGMGVARAAMLA